MASLIPTTYASNVFLESCDDILGGKPPSHLLPSKHPFHNLWQDMLSKLTSNSPQSEIVIDSYISVFIKDPNWKTSLSVARIAERRQEMTTLLRDHPPDIVVLDHPMDRGCEVHIQRPGIRSFICITEYWVQRWSRAVEYEPGERLALALETILRITIAHELGHWMTSLSVDPKSKNLFGAEQSGQFNTETQTKIFREHFDPRILCETWNAKKEGAGNFVELAAMGGIVGFHMARSDVYIQISETQCWSPSNNFLKLVCEFGTYYFTPCDGDILLMGSAKPGTLPSPFCPHSTSGQRSAEYGIASITQHEPNPSSIIS